MGKLIYFVDDDKMILNLLEYTFSSRDEYKVISFRKGEDCVAVMDKNPDLIVLDHSFLVDNSKYSTGLEILKDIRIQKRDVPVIVLTGEQKEEVKQEYVKNGVQKFINKDSFFIDTLIESIDKVLQEN
jgi:two-component system, OmpR family, response regulator